MPDLRLRLTDTRVDNLPLAAAGQYLARDTERRSFFVLVGKTTKTFMVVLPEASWSGTGSAPAAGAQRVLRAREAAGPFGTSRPSEIRPLHTTVGTCHGTWLRRRRLFTSP